MYWVYKTRGFSQGHLDRIFTRQLKRAYVKFLKSDFCQEYKGSSDDILPYGTILKLRKLADRIEIDYHTFWRLAFCGYARGEGFHFNDLKWEMGETQMRLYIADSWIYDSATWLYFKPWFNARGYNGLQAQKDFHAWQIKRMAARFKSHELINRLHGAIKDGRLPVEYLKSEILN